MRIDPKPGRTAPLLEGDEALPFACSRRREPEVCDLNNWQIEETRKAFAAADRGEFASKRNVRRTFEKWIRGGRLRAKG